MYRTTAAHILGSPVADVTQQQRQIYGKVPELALGYGGAVGTFHTMARNYGVRITDAEAVRIVRHWRTANAWCVQYWHAVKQAAERAIQQPGVVFSAGRITYLYHRHTRILWCALPDSRIICYRNIHYDAAGELCALYATAQPGQDDPEAAWPTTRLWHGLLTENVTQATAASVMRYALRVLTARGFRIVGHTHDEVLLEVATTALTGKALQQQVWAAVSSAMTQLPAWGEGLPLAVDIAYGERYKIAA